MRGDLDAVGRGVWQATLRVKPLRSRASTLPRAEDYQYVACVNSGGGVCAGRDVGLAALAIAWLSLYGTNVRIGLFGGISRQHIIVEFYFVSPSFLIQ